MCCCVDRCFPPVLGQKTRYCTITDTLMVRKGAGSVFCQYSHKIQPSPCFKDKKTQAGGTLPSPSPAKPVLRGCFGSQGAVFLLKNETLVTTKPVTQLYFNI